MTTSTKVLAFGGVGLAVLYLAQKARTVANLIFQAGAVQSMSFDNLAPVLTFSVIVQNTSPLNVSVNSFAGNIISNGTFVGNIYNFMPVVLPANSQTIVMISARLNSLGIVNEIIRAFQFRNTTQDVQIQGFANSGFLQIPINLKFTVGG